VVDEKRIMLKKGKEGKRKEEERKEEERRRIN
jgi:hypothetical protein